MSKGIIKFLVKISTISVLLVVLFNVGVAFYDNNANNKISNKTQNKHIYIKSNSIILGGAGVAISTNLGIRYKERSSLPATIYKDVMSIGEIMTNKNSAEKNIITNNMLEIRAYLNILRTDVINIIKKSNDKSTTLKALIAQYEYRYKVAYKNIKNLETQKGILETSMKNDINKINSLKSKISTDFSGFKTNQTLENINNYLKLKKEYNYSKIYVVYISQFIYQYNYLNNYNKILLDTLINNKEAIIKDAYIVIPSSGTQLMKKLNLIYSEKAYKGK